MSRVLILLLSWVFIGVACTTGKTPSQEDAKSRLSNYISKTFQVQKIEDRTTLESFLTGEAKQRMVSWDDEQFLRAFLDSKRKFEKLAFKEVQRINDQEVAITYELTYLDKNAKKDIRMTNKKMAYLTRENDVWYIKDVKNIKLLVEYQDEMTLP